MSKNLFSRILPGPSPARRLIAASARLLAGTAFIAQAFTSPASAQNVPPGPVKHVLHVSVDALGAKYLEKFLAESPQEFSTFGRLIREGAGTLNARTDYSHTNTLPNHTCMVTCRPVRSQENWPEARGHCWEWNSEFPSEKAPASLHAVNPDKGYTSSTFDVVHEAGYNTALYSGKSKFRLYSVSFGPEFGKEGPNGRNKVDQAHIVSKSIQPNLLEDLKTNKPAYAFVHYKEPDVAGHTFGYLGDEYRNAIKGVDANLGELLTFLETDPEYKGRTAIILSADHGGEPGTKGHGNAAHPYCHTIPFLVWGEGVAKGADLYELNKDSRLNPGDGRPAYAPTGQPIRNGDGGNLALTLLGLPAIPGSTINVKQDLKVK